MATAAWSALAAVQVLGFGQKRAMASNDQRGSQMLETEDLTEHMASHPVIKDTAYIYIYIDLERERERERESCTMI